MFIFIGKPKNILRKTASIVCIPGVFIFVQACSGIPGSSETSGQTSTQTPQTQVEMEEERARELYVSRDHEDHPVPRRGYDEAIRRKAKIDSIFLAVTEGVMDYEKISYRSRIGDMDIPAYVYQPIEKRGPRGHAALVWVHGGVHGNLSANYYPFIKEAVDKGYVVIAPEYRGSAGYGREHHNAIDYGGYEVDDVVTAVDYLKKNYPHVDPDRIGMIGWSHGGFITVHSLAREPGVFRCGVAIVPVTNLIFRLSYKGPRYQRNFSTQKRVLGLPFEQREIYIERSPVYQVDKIRDPILVHLATNDEDVNFVEAEMLINALLVKKPDLAETKIYIDPPGGHGFSRRVDRSTLEPQWTKEMRDSWNLTWAFLEWNLQPYVDKSK